MTSRDSFYSSPPSPRSKRPSCGSWPHSEYVARRENVVVVGNSGTGKTHVALELGLAACQKANQKLSKT